MEKSFTMEPKDSEEELERSKKAESDDDEEVARKFAEEEKAIKEKLESWKKRIAELTKEWRDARRLFVQTEHEIAVDYAVGCKTYIPDHIWHILLKNPTDGIQLSCNKGVPIEFNGPVPFLKKMRMNSKRQMTDLSLESVLQHDDPTQSDIVRTTAGLQHIIKQLYHAPTASMNSYVRVKKLT